MEITKIWRKRRKKENFVPPKWKKTVKSHGHFSKFKKGMSTVMLWHHYTQSCNFPWLAVSYPIWRNLTKSFVLITVVSLPQTPQKITKQTKQMHASQIYWLMSQTTHTIFVSMFNLMIILYYLYTEVVCYLL